MTRHRRLGVLFGLLAFAGLCVAALLSPLSPSSRFSGIPGIEDDITDRIENVLAAQGVSNADVSVDGQDVSVLLTEATDMNPQMLGELITAEDGVGAVTIAADAAIDVQPADPDPAPTAETVPTAEPAPTAETVPTAEPAPQPDPTEEPEPEPTATTAPEPTATPEAPSVEELVAGLDTSGITFEPGTAELTAADQDVLDGLAPQLQQLGGIALEVQAHTDSLGDPDVNFLLSQERAEAVTNYLIGQGVDAPVLTPRGYGASNPIADNSTEQGRAANQRVALVVEGN